MGNLASPNVGAKYPPPAYPPCIVMRASPAGGLGLYNLGGGTLDNPFDGTQLVGDNIVCTEARAAQVVAELTPVLVGKKLAAIIGPVGEIVYLNASIPSSVPFGTDPDQLNAYTLVDTIAQAEGDLEAATVAGNIQELVVQEEEHGVGAPHHWAYDTAGGEFKSPQLRIVWD
jgi:hypothetical protein